jgi:PadR family transcriptional regulator, regulatory protein AphA
MLTAAGRAALREWLARPTQFPRIQSEAMVRLTAGDLVDDAALLESLRSLRPELDEVAAQLEEAERLAATMELAGLEPAASWVRFGRPNRSNSADLQDI